ncbi:MAG: integrase core domain-containing protein, partial [Akkermansia sp.]|nr:integrase core domain-containing protein [Akkermansia sp.]
MAGAASMTLQAKRVKWSFIAHILSFYVFVDKNRFFLHREPKNLDEAIEMTSEWMEYYNRERPHSSLK